MASQPTPHDPLAANPLAAGLRQMIAVLEQERHALAALDADALVICARDKEALCDRLGALAPQPLETDIRTLAETAQRLNEVNRRVRNLLAANIAARIEALGGQRRSRRIAHGPAARSGAGTPLA